MYPNPIDGIVNIYLNGLEIRGLILYNSIGETVYTENTIKLNHLQINTSKFNSGIYTVQLNSKTQIINKKTNYQLI